jgi:hypothetical protein
MSEDSTVTGQQDGAGDDSFVAGLALPAAALEVADR